jgi:hypothetical protein
MGVPQQTRRAGRSNGLRVRVIESPCEQITAEPIPEGLLANGGEFGFELIDFHLRVGDFLLLGLDFGFFGVYSRGPVFVGDVIRLAVVRLRIERKFALEDIEIGLYGLQMGLGRGEIGLNRRDFGGGLACLGLVSCRSGLVRQQWLLVSP